MFVIELKRHHIQDRLLQIFMLLLRLDHRPHIIAVRNWLALKFCSHHLVRLLRLGHEIHVLFLLLLAASRLFEMLLGECRYGWVRSTTLIKYCARVYLAASRASDHSTCRLRWWLLRIPLIKEDRLLVGFSSEFTIIYV